MQSDWRLKLSIRRCVFAIALLLATSFRLNASGDAHLKTVLEGRYADMKAAMASRDDSAIRGLLAPDFKAVDVSGAVQDANAMIKEVTSLPKDPNKQSTTTLTGVKRIADTAVVSQQYHMTTMRNPSDGSPPKAIDLQATSTDTWRLIKDQWLLEQTATDEMQVMINGSIVSHRKRQEPN